jgi:hypothetical protein
MYRLRVEFPAVGTVYTLTAEAGAYAMTGQASALSVVGVPEIPPGLALDARDAQYYLFQATPASSLPSRLTANPLHNLAYDVWGPTNKWVDMHTQWLWTNLGGDWIDAMLTPQGSTAWGTVNSPLGSPATVYDHTINLTAAVQNVQVNERWCAFNIVGGASYRAIASHKYTPDTSKRPSIEVTYTDTTTATLACWVCATTSGASASPATTAEVMPVPLSGSTDRLHMEFARPTKPVASATLHFSTTTSNFGGAVPISVRGILTPPTRGPVVTGGLAETAGGLLDADLPGHASVVFCQRIMDGTPQTDFVAPINISYTDSDFSPELFGGAVDTGKMPYIYPGKWINGNDFTPTPPTDQFNLTKVESSYTGEGFEPLAPGMGALRTHVDAIAVVDGDMVGNGGIGICNARMPLPIDRIGLQDRIFIRWYERTHLVPIYSPMAPENRKHVWQDIGHTTPRWTDRSGKGGLGPNHQTTDGGFSGSSGGRWGWQMRNSWYLCDNNVGGPDEGTITYGFHLYDFTTNNPVGHQYGSADIGIGERFGNIGGFGGTQNFDQWYCHETEIKLNTVASVTYPDFIADGYLRHWIDGRLVYERTNMVFRQLPAATSRPVGGSYLTPIRELGIREIILNVFYGGQTWNTEAVTMFYTGIVVSDEYIGPMQLAAAPGYFSNVTNVSNDAYVPTADLNQSLIVSLHGSGTNYDAFFGAKYTADLAGGLEYAGNDTQFKFAIQSSNSGSIKQATVNPSDRQADLPAGGRRESQWMGWTDGPDVGRLNLYTERRLDVMLDWIAANYPQISTTKRVLTGGSMGAFGTLTYGLRRADKFAALYPDRPRWQSAPTAGTVWVPDWDVGVNATYTFAAAPLLRDEDGGYSAAEHQDHLAWISNPANELPWIGWCIGRNDGGGPWADQLAAVAALQARGAAFAFYWNDGNHSGGARLYFEIVPTYPFHLWELGKGYPIFTEHSLDDDPTVDIEGGINIGLSFRNVVETTSTWSCEVRHQGTTFRPAQACTVKVKPKSWIYTGSPAAQTVSLPAAGAWVTVSF